MKDLFGREVKRGDIIVYGEKKRAGQFHSFTETKLGVVSKVGKGKPKLVKGRLDLDGNKIYSQPIEKIVFYPMSEQAISPYNIRSDKNGKIIKHPLLTTEAILINRETLTDKWPIIYDEICRMYKIC